MKSHTNAQKMAMTVADPKATPQPKERTNRGTSEVEAIPHDARAIHHARNKPYVAPGNGCCIGPEARFCRQEGADAAKQRPATHNPRCGDIGCT